jgi:hypothetical protein
VNQPAEKSLRLPPYATQVSAAVKTIFISAGPGAWERAKRWKWSGRPGLVADPTVDPELIRWPVEGGNVALIATDLPEADLLKLLAALRRAKPAVIAVLHGPSDDDELEILRASDG